MATFKVWLTVKDSYGNTKEVDGGTIDVNLAENLTQEDISHIEEALPLDNYLKKDETDYLATDVEVQQAVEQSSSIKYSALNLKAD